MVAAGVIDTDVADELVGVAPEVKDRLAAYFVDVASGLVRSEQRRNAELYARGLLEAGARKSIEPMVGRLGGGAFEYESLQNFIADSPCAASSGRSASMSRRVMCANSAPRSSRSTPAILRLDKS